MAVGLSNQIANATADPFITNSAGQMYGRQRVHQDVTTLAAPVLNTEAFRAARVPSNARISRIEILSTAVTGPLGTTADIGVGNIDGTVVDDDLFASAEDLQDVVGAVNFRFLPDGLLDIDTIGLMLWELLGLSEDPSIEFEITATVTVETGGTAGDVGVIVEWTVAS